MFGRQWVFFMTLHSYGQLWLLPYGYTPDDPPTYDELVGDSSYAISTTLLSLLILIFATVPANTVAATAAATLLLLNLVLLILLLLLKY